MTALVLVIHRSEAMTLSAVEMLQYMDILAFGARPKEALSEISTRYRAVLFLYPEQLPDMREYLGRLRAFGGDVPFFAISDDESLMNDPSLFLHVFRTGTMSSTVATEMVRLTRERGLPCIGDYRLSGIDASFHLFNCYFYQTPVTLTATEARILRFLIRAFPARVGAREMLPYIFSPTKLPDPATVRTHICSINRKFREHNDGRRIIDLTPRLGYRILTPIHDEELLLFV